MSNTIKLRKGAVADLPTLEQSEMGYCTDTDQVFIGDGSANHEFCMMPDGVVTKTAAATLVVTDRGLVLVSCATTPYTITLPTAVGNGGLMYRFVKTDANYNLITLDGDGSETFSYANRAGSAQTTYPRLNTFNASVTIMSDGANWICLEEQIGQVPDAYAYLSADQDNLVNNTWTLVQLNTELHDIGSNWNSSTYLFTAPVPGIYEISIMGVIDTTDASADKRVAVACYKNGSAQAYGNYQTSTTDYFSMPLWCRLEMTLGQYAQMYAKSEYGDDTMDMNGGSYKETKMHIWLVEKT